MIIGHSHYTNLGKGLWGNSRETPIATIEAVQFQPAINHEIPAVCSTRRMVLIV